jgi:hypothetical protein
MVIIPTFFYDFLNVHHDINLFNYEHSNRNEVKGKTIDMLIEIYSVETQKVQ